ncbi:MAG: hypothetical protein ACOY93_14480 [Bacillota bacterium]
MRRLGFLVLLGTMLLSLALPAWAAPAVEMTAQAANEGRVKQGGWVTVLVELANQGGEVSGELVVEFDAEFSHPQYVVPVTLPAGGRKRIPVSLEASQGSWPVLVRFYVDRKEVASQRLTLTWLPPQGRLVGVLSGDELGIPALNQLQGAQNQSSQVVRLSAETLPDRAALLEDFDVIALSRFDSSALSPEQLRALELWVGRGGTLMLAGGPEWKRTLGALPPSLVPVEVTEVREVELQPLTDVGGRPVSGKGPVSVARLRTGHGLVFSEGVPLVASAPAGAGRVLFLAFDPGLNPIVTWQGQPQLYNRLLMAGAQANPRWPNEREWMLQQALQQIPDWGLPGVWTVALLLGSYLLLVGPANYLVLKRLDRREWSWVSVPALSLLFLGLVYLMGFGRFQPLVSHLITVTELPPGTGVGTMTSYLGLYSPSRSTLSIAVEDARLVRPFVRGGIRMGEVSARVVAGDKTTVELRGMNSYQMSGFSMEHDIPLKGGGLELIEARMEDGTLTGRLVNRLDRAVEGLLLVAGNVAHPLPPLEPGATSEPFQINVGQWDRVDPRAPMGRVPDALLSPENGPEEGRRRMIRDYVLNTTIHHRSGGLLVTGWTAEPLVAPRLPDLGKLAQGANMIFAMLPLPVGEEGSDIPPGLVTGQPLDPNGVNWIGNGFMLRPGTHSFTLVLPPLDPSRVDSVTLHARAPATPMLRLAVRNQRSGEWLPFSDPSYTLPNWQEFVSPAGLIELRYETQEHLEIQSPTVAVKGVSR